MDSAPVFHWLAFTAWIVMTFGFCLVALLVIWSKFRTTTRPDHLPLNDTKSLPGVTVVRPLKGIDIQLKENLASLFRQDYPLFQVVFCVASADDPVIPLVVQWMQDYSHVDTQLLIGEQVVGVNPKINNLIRGYEAAKHPILWILDANVRLAHRHVMKRAVTELVKPGVGLVHHVPIAIHATTVGSRLEQMFLDTAHARMYVSINATGLASCVNGKSNMWRKKDLEQCGGLRCFGGFLAEDNVIGEKIMNLGLSHTLLSDAVWQPMGATALMDFFSRRARWTRIRKYNVTAATLLEPFTESLVCGLYGCWACMQLFGLEWEMVPLWWVGHMLMWLVCDMAVFTVFMQSRGGWTNETEQTDVVVVEQHEQKEGVTGMWVLVWLVREITALPLWMYAIAGNHVHWRGRAFRLRSNGTAVEM